MDVQKLLPGTITRVDNLWGFACFVSIKNNIENMKSSLWIPNFDNIKYKYLS